MLPFFLQLTTYLPKFKPPFKQTMVSQDDFDNAQINQPSWSVEFWIIRTFAVFFPFSIFNLIFHPYGISGQKCHLYLLISHHYVIEENLFA